MANTHETAQPTEVKQRFKGNKRENFVRLGNARLTRITKAVRTLGSLANTTAYRFDEHDVEAIFTHLDDEINKIKGKFRTALDRKHRGETDQVVLR